jgi:YHS domain-containing protein
MKFHKSHFALPGFLTVLLMVSPALSAQQGHQHGQMTHMKMTADTSATPGETQLVQTVCPVMAGTLNRNLYVDTNGRRVYFCCEACLESFNKNPQKYIKTSEEKGIQFEAAPGPQQSQDNPPVSEQ